MRRSNPRRTPARFAVIATVALGGWLLASPAGASAAPVDLASGETTLTVKPKVAGALEKAGIGVSPLHPAEAGKDGIAFPITGGKLDPKKGTGKITHEGGLEFTSDSGSLAITDFVVKLDRSPTLVATAGDGKVTVFDLDVRKAEIGRNGIAYEVSNVKANLTKDAAKALNETLGVNAFEKGLTVGKTNTTAVPRTLELAKKGATTLALDPGAAAALESEGIAVAPIKGATAGNDGIAFPITGGEADSETLAGEITHGGGLRFSEGDAQLDLTKFTINVDDEPDLTAKAGGSRVSILTLDLSGATVDIDGRNITVSGVDAHLTQAAADALNSTFSTSAFTEGLLLGTATVAAKAK